MTARSRTIMLIGLVVAGTVVIGAGRSAVQPPTPGFDARAAAAYLDARAEWWSTWPNAARDRGTFCISCHTTLPYALARPALRATPRRA